MVLITLMLIYMYILCTDIQVLQHALTDEKQAQGTIIDNNPNKPQDYLNSFY